MEDGVAATMLMMRLIGGGGAREGEVFYSREVVRLEYRVG